jgi:DNA-binding transcriptional LysR family regulator
MIELRHLRYFIAVAEELHFGKAAERLHIAQPPLSQQIRQLEAELGFQLFHRTKRSVKLTEAGQIFFTESQRLFRQLDQAIELGRQTSRGEVGQLIIGFVSSTAYNVLPDILRSFRATVPTVKLELHELTTDQQLQWLRENRLDVGLLRPPVEDIDNAFQLSVIFQEPLVVALPESHPLATATEISPSALATEPFIIFPRTLAPGLYDQIISFCQQAGFSPTVVQEAIQMQTIISLVAAEIGVAIVPQSLQNLQRTGVVYKRFNQETPQAAIALIYRQDNTAPAVQKFLEVVQQVTRPRCSADTARVAPTDSSACP